VLASITSQTTAWIAQYGVYAVFVLMAFDALLPFGGELVMLYAGALAAGAVAGQHATLFGVTLAGGTQSYVTLALAGALGYLLGALVGWVIGVRGGRALIERHGRWLHVSPEAWSRAESWFDRYGPRAVFFGRLTPVVRSFISIPAGALGSPLASYTLLTLLGSLLWCFAFAAVGWAVGGSWTSIHHGFRFADYVAVAAVAAVAATVVVRRLRRVRTAA
jgi:membrane protein DedA with SNARE-associated domain